MNNTQRLLPGTLLACLGILCAPARATDSGATTAAMTVSASTGHQRQVQIGGTGIKVSDGSRQIRIGTNGISITNEPPSVTTNVPVPPIPPVDVQVPPIQVRFHAGPDGDRRNCHGGKEIVAIGHNATLPAGEDACDVVSIFGNAEVHGNVSDSVVSVFGNSQVDGNVGNSAVSVLGNMSVDSAVGQSAVAVLGNVHLGPHAKIGGQVVNILGTTTSAPTTVIQGGTVNLMSGVARAMPGLSAWTEHCLIFGRLLAPRLDIGWAWGLTLAVLAFYVLLAALFREGLTRCVHTLEEHPGPSILAALAMVMLTPIVMLALVMTVVGIAVIPLLWFALFCAAIFGRVVTLGWLGGRLMRAAPAGAAQPLLHVLLGGVVVLLLYMVPLLGFIVWATVGMLGFGALSYTALLAIRSARAAPSGFRPATIASPASPGIDSSASQTWTEAPATPGAETGGASGTAASDPAAAATLDLTTLPRAGFWLRMAALLIDLVLVGFALGMIGHHGHHGTDGMLLVLAGYGAVMWKLNGSTVGGIICNLKIVRLDGRPVGWETAILRALGCFLSLVAAGLGFFWIAFDRDHQAWHDKIAGTVVVLVPKSRGLV